MYTFTETKYKKEVEPILRKVFIEDDPYSNAFSSTITERLIIFPCEMYLEYNLIEGLIAAAANLEEESCYLKNSWSDLDNPGHYHLSLLEFYEEQLGSSRSINFDAWISYIIFSEKGTWGLMTSDERHGLLGGSPQFVNKVREFVPNLDDQVYLFIQKLQSFSRHLPGARLEWVPKLFTHVYGQKTAEKMLKEAELL